MLPRVILVCNTNMSPSPLAGSQWGQFSSFCFLILDNLNNLNWCTLHTKLVCNVSGSQWGQFSWFRFILFLTISNWSYLWHNSNRNFILFHFINSILLVIMICCILTTLLCIDREWRHGKYVVKNKGHKVSFSFILLVLTAGKWREKS